MTRRAGMTMIEVAVAMVVLAALFGLSMAAFDASRKPAAEGAVRAYLLSLGDTTLVRLERELSSADYASAAEVCGGWDGTTFTADGAVAPDEGKGNAVQMFPVTGWNTTSDRPVTGPAVVYAFREAERDPADSADNDGDGLVDEMELVRAESGVVVTILDDILNDSVAATQQPEFRQVGYLAIPPQRAELELRFTLSRRIGNGEFVTVTFAKVISLRNLM